MLTTLLTSVLFAAPGSAGVYLPPLQPPDESMVVVVTVPESDLAELVPILSFESPESGQIVRRRLNPVQPGTTTVRELTAPGLAGLWRVTLTVMANEETAAQTDGGTVRILPFWLFLGLLVGLFASAIAGARFALRWGRRGLLAYAAALLLTGVFWVPVVFAYYSLFGVLAIVTTVLAFRLRVSPRRFLLAACIAFAVFQELFFGLLPHKSYWTAPVVSLTILWGLWHLLRLVFRMSETGLVVATWTVTVVLSVVYVLCDVYKSFFLDYPSIAGGTAAGQLGQVVDSMAVVIRVPHVLALAWPFGVLGFFFWLRAAGKAAAMGAPDATPVVSPPS